jgi:very-short-patch-repair endonuclease
MAKLSKLNAPFHYGASPSIFERANLLRKNLTGAELLLWKNLRNRKLMGCKFRRQHPVGKYIVDFYCHEKLLVIELDGGIHENPDVKERDEGREYDLNSLGLTIIRFKNEEIESNLDTILNEIKEYL